MVSADSGAAAPSSVPAPDADKSCFICLQTAAETPDAVWVTPCPCSLDAHEDCMLQWIAETEVNTGRPVQGRGRGKAKKLRCPACNARIRTIEAEDSLLVFRDTLATLYRRSAAPMLTSMVMAMGVAGSSFYGQQAMIVFAGEGTTIEWMLAGFASISSGSGGVIEPGSLEHARIKLDYVGRFFLLNLVAPGLLLQRALPSLANFLSWPASMVYGASLLWRNGGRPPRWPPSGPWVLAAMPTISIAYATVYYNVFGSLERRLNRALRGRPEEEDEQQQQPHELRAPAGIDQGDNNAADQPQGIVAGLRRIGAAVGQLLRDEEDEDHHDPDHDHGHEHDQIEGGNANAPPPLAAPVAAPEQQPQEQQEQEQQPEQQPEEPAEQPAQQGQDEEQPQAEPAGPVVNDDDNDENTWVDEVDDDEILPPREVRDDDENILGERINDDDSDDGGDDDGALPPPDILRARGEINVDVNVDGNGNVEIAADVPLDLADFDFADNMADIADDIRNLRLAQELLAADVEAMEGQGGAGGVPAFGARNIGVNANANANQVERGGGGGGGGGILFSDVIAAMTTQLLLPHAASAAGSLLLHVLPRSWVVPSSAGGKGFLSKKWGRSLVGGMLWIVLRDAWSLFIKYRRVQLKRQRKIKNVDRKRRGDAAAAATATTTT